MSKQLTDTQLLDCIANSTSLASSTKLGYQKTCRSFFMHACSDWQARQNPLLNSILNFEASKKAILQSDNALRTKHAWVKTVRNIFHHALECPEAKNNKEFQDVKSKWEELNKEISVEVDRIAKTSLLSKREEESWCPHSEWREKEEKLRETEFGSPHHLLIGFSGGCGFPPLRGGDLGLVSVVSSREKEADDKNKEGGNVLVWNGPDSESFLLVRNHKTTKTHGTLKRPIPQSLKDIVNESFKKHPRSTLFVSPKTNVQFETEESFSRWAQRAFKKIFDGKAVTMNTARHSFISALDTHKMSTQDLEDVATLMGQSIGEQRKYFRLSPKRLREKRLGINLNQEGEYEIPMLESPRRSSHSSLSLSTINGGKKEKDRDEEKEKYTERQKKEKQKEKVKLEQEKEKEKEKDSVAEVSTIVRQDTASLSLKNPSPRHGHDSRVRRVIRIR
jgi:hypothetical protein